LQWRTTYSEYELIKKESTVSSLRDDWNDDDIRNKDGNCG